MSIFNYKQRNNIILASIVILGCFILFALSGLFSSILGAIVLFTIFRPVYKYFVEKKQWNKTAGYLINYPCFINCNCYPLNVVKHYGS